MLQSIVYILNMFTDTLLPYNDYFKMGIGFDIKIKPLYKWLSHLQLDFPREFQSNVHV